MPDIFKALATIIVWVLFIGGLFLVATSLLFGTLSGDLFVVGKTPSIFYPIAWGLATAMGILAVCAMKVRKLLE